MLPEYKTTARWGIGHERVLRSGQRIVVFDPDTDKPISGIFGKERFECMACGRYFLRYESQHKRTTFCSRKCSHGANNGKPQAKIMMCMNCGFPTKNARKTCSRACLYIIHRKNQIRYI